MVTNLSNLTSATLNEVLGELKALHGQVTSQIIADLIDMHQSDSNRMIKLYQRYKAQDVPIFDRQVAEYETINHQLNNDFFGEIVDTKVGYFMGIPITY